MSASGKAAPRLPGWLHAYRRADLAGDVGAGIVVAMMMIPQGMAYPLVACCAWVFSRTSFRAP